MKIYIDVDGTVVDTPSAMATWYNKKYNGNAVGSKIFEWDAQDQCPKLTKTDLVDLFEDDYFFDNLHPIKDAQDILHRMSKFPGYDFSFCSIGTAGNLRKKEMYLKKHFPFIKKYVMIEKEYVEMGKDGYVNDGLLVDDNKYNLDGSAKYEVLFKPDGDKQWNIGYRGIVATNWIQVANCIYQLYNKEFANVI